MDTTRRSSSSPSCGKPGPPPRRIAATPAGVAAGERPSTQGPRDGRLCTRGRRSRVAAAATTGSEWLFLKLYAPRTWEDDLIASYLYPFAEQRCAAAEADSWFFIRYSDPEPHLRLRFHGMPERLMGQLFPRAAQWAGEP